MGLLVEGVAGWVLVLQGTNLMDVSGKSGLRYWLFWWGCRSRCLGGVGQLFEGAVWLGLVMVGSSVVPVWLARELVTVRTRSGLCGYCI